MLVGVVERPDGAESADRFTARCLGVTDIGNLVDEEHELTPVAQVTTALVLAEWIGVHEQACEVGAGQYSAPPRWTQTEIGGRVLRHPQCLRAFFPAGTVLADVGCVIGIDIRRGLMSDLSVSVYVRPEHQSGAREVLDRLAARADEQLLTSVVEEAEKLGGPVLLVLEDVDLWCADRRGGRSGLSELLQAMDIAADARILTLASTNDATTLDQAAIRTGRFDAIVEVGFPSRAAAARILASLVAGLPGGSGVDTATVVGRLPEQISGSDLREIVRRAVLSVPDGEPISTDGLLAEVGSGRYRAAVPDGLYL